MAIGDLITTVAWDTGCSVTNSTYMRFSPSGELQESVSFDIVDATAENLIAYCFAVAASVGDAYAAFYSISGPVRNVATFNTGFTSIPQTTEFSQIAMLTYGMDGNLYAGTYAELSAGSSTPHPGTGLLYQVTEGDELLDSFDNLEWSTSPYPYTTLIGMSGYAVNGIFYYVDEIGFSNIRRYDLAEHVRLDPIELADISHVFPVRDSSGDLFAQNTNLTADLYRLAPGGEVIDQFSHPFSGGPLNNNGIPRWIAADRLDTQSVWALTASGGFPGYRAVFTKYDTSAREIVTQFSGDDAATALPQAINSFQTWAGLDILGPIGTPSGLGRRLTYGTIVG